MGPLNALQRKELSGQTTTISPESITPHARLLSDLAPKQLIGSFQNTALSSRDRACRVLVTQANAAVISVFGFVYWTKIPRNASYALRPIVESFFFGAQELQTSPSFLPQSRPAEPNGFRASESELNVLPMSDVALFLIRLRALLNVELRYRGRILKSQKNPTTTARMFVRESDTVIMRYIDCLVVVYSLESGIAKYCRKWKKIYGIQYRIGDRAY